jgi:hypothetical protein
MSKMKLALDVVQDLRNLADSLEALAGAAMGESPVAPTEPQPPTTESPNHNFCDDPTQPECQMPDSREYPKLTLVELRAFVAGKSTLENRPRIKAILERYGVKKLTELAEDQYPALMREVEAL